MTGEEGRESPVRTGDPAPTRPDTWHGSTRRMRSVELVLDADVLIGALDSNDPHHARARALFNA
jgi:hypothetical protein